MWGLKSKAQNILINNIAEIDKTRKAEASENYLQDQDMYEGSLDTKELIFVNLKKEADRTVRDLGKCVDEVNSFDDNKSDKKRVSKVLGVIKKISYNLRSMLLVFIQEFCD